MADWENDNRLTIERAVINARKARERYAPNWKKITGQMVTKFYDGGETGAPAFWNYPYLYTTTFLPRLCSRIPEVEVQAERGPIHTHIAQAVQSAIEIILRRQKFDRVLRRAVQNGFFSAMILKTGLMPSTSEDVDGLGTDPGFFYGNTGGLATNIPFVKAVSPYKFLWDDTASSFEHSSFAGEEFDRDCESVLNDSRYDPAALALIKDTKSSYSTEPRQAGLDFDGEVPFYRLIELHVRPTNTIYTLCETSRDKFTVLRKAPFNGRPTGPYHMGGFTDVPDRPFPLAPLVAAWKNIQEHEKNEARMSEDAWSEKRVATTDTDNAAGAKKFKEARHNDLVIGVGSVKEVLVGGLSDTRLVFNQHAKSAVEMNTGIDAARRGVAGGPDQTATQTRSVDNNASNRESDMRLSVAKLAEEVIEDIKWYIITDESVKVAGVTRDAYSGVERSIVVQGGPQATDPISGEPVAGMLDPDDFSVSIDPESLYQSMDEVRAARSIQQLTFVTGPLRQALMTQGMDINMWGVVRDVARDAGLSWLPKNIIPLSPMAMQIQQMGEAGQPEQMAGDLVKTGESSGGVQSDIMNSPATNTAISDATSRASPMRQANTPYGANNAETSPM